MVLKHLLISMRPKQWVKNLFLFAALIFVRDFTDPAKIVLACQAFLIFCAAASAVYLANDIADAPADRLHAHKKHRPIASGTISPMLAGTVAGLILGLALGFAFWSINYEFFLATLGYVMLNSLYTFVLKRVVIIDVFCIAIGFVLRVIAGALAIGVSFSPWLIFCTFFLTLLLAVTKRKNELRVSGAHSRQVLKDYSVQFIDQMNMIILPLTLVTYTFYTFSSEHSRLLMLTVPVVMYGMLRFVYINDRKSISDDGPTDDLWRDRPLQLTLVVWILLSVLILVWQK